MQKHRGDTMTTAVLHGGPLDGAEATLDDGDAPKGLVVGAAVWDGSYVVTSPHASGAVPHVYTLFRVASESGLAFYKYGGIAR